MKTPFLAFFAFFLTGLLLAEGDSGFRPLFNGKDLSGWVVVNTAPSTWHFNDEGYLVCSGKPIGEIRTERMYQNFILELEWRHMKPRGNAGIFVWADDITARGQPFHRGVEVQVLENAYGQSKSYTTHGDIFPIHGATMDPVNGRGGSRAFPTEFRSNPSPEWNHYRIECNDGDISLAVNGKVVTRGENCSPRKGYICIESEGGIVHYRNVRIKELPDTPIEPEHVAIENRGYRSLYTGVDLSGWNDAPGWKSKDWVLASGENAEPLKTAEKLPQNLGFIVDFKLNESSGKPAIRVHDHTIEIDREDHTLAPLLEKSGRWNRLEGVVSEGSLSLQVNGQAWKSNVPPPPHETPPALALLPDGPADWANIYVRNVE